MSRICLFPIRLFTASWQMSFHPTAFQGEIHGPGLRDLTGLASSLHHCGH